MFALYERHKIQSEWSEPQTSFRLWSSDIDYYQSTKELKSWFSADTDMEEQTEDSFDETMQKVNWKKFIMK